MGFLIFMVVRLVDFYINYFKLNLMDGASTQVVGQKIEKTILIKRVDLAISTVEVTKPVYLLGEYELHILTESTNELKDWQKRMIQIGVGLSNSYPN